MPDDFCSATAEDVSADGRVIVGKGRFGRHCFYTTALRWVDGGPPEDILASEEPPLTQIDPTISPLAVSSDGRVVVGAMNILPPDLDLGDHPIVGLVLSFRWTEEDGVQLLHEPVEVEETPELRSFAADVSADGSVVVGTTWRRHGPEYPFRWTEETGLVRLDLPDEARRGQALFVSADGVIATGFAVRPGVARVESIVWTEATGTRPLQALPVVEDPPGSGTVFFPGRGRRSRHLAVWAEDSEIVATPLPVGEAMDRTVYPLALSADGATVVGWMETGDSSRYAGAMIWRDVLGVRSLDELVAPPFDPDEIWLGRANGVSADGSVIVGQAVQSGEVSIRHRERPFVVRLELE